MKGFETMEVKKDMIFYAAVLCLSVVAGWVAFSYPADSSTFPRILCMALAALSAIAIFKTSRARGAQQREGQEKKAEAAVLPRNSILVFMATALYLWALSTIGFFVSSYCYVVAITYFLKYRNKAALLIWPLVLCGLIWVVFCKFLNVPTPAGYLF